jgi:hypothetical protein
VSTHDPYNDPQTAITKLSAVPAKRSSATVLKLRLSLIFAGIAFASLSGIFALYSVLTFQPAKVDVLVANPRGQAVAELAAAAYLGGYTIALDTTKGVDFAPSVPVATVGPIVWSGYTRYQLSGIEVEQHKFLFNHRFLNDNNQEVSEQMSLIILVAILPKNTINQGDYTVALAAQPSISLELPVSVSAILDYSDRGTSVPSPVLAKIELWCAAWASGDQAAIKSISGDTDPNFTIYHVFGGYTCDSIQALSAAPLATPDDLVMRVRLVLKSANGSILLTDMDLTITSATSGIPNVSSWGPAGSTSLGVDYIRVGG